MQVKKFEARSMKEALELVKNQLGPDAIILSAKDNSRGFGLSGHNSVEITAAVSEETLQKKRFVESRLRAQDREKIQRAPARVQKQFIDNMVDRYNAENAPRRGITSTRYIEIDERQPSYQAEDYDMVEEEFYAAESTAAPIRPTQAQPQTYAPQRNPSPASLPIDRAGERIKTAAQRAWNAMHAGSEWGFKSSTEQAAREKVAEEWTSAPAAAVHAQPQNRRHAPVQATAAAAVPRQANPSAPAAANVEGVEIGALRAELAQLKTALSSFQQVPQTMMGQHPGSEYGLPYDLASTFEKLTSAGIAAEFVAEILQVAQSEMPAVRFKNKALIEGWVAKYFLDNTKIVGDMQGTKVQVFVGPAGSGKTSTLVKMAAHYVVNGHKKVALITTDTKVGAADQLRIYSQILNVPFAIVRSAQDWDYVMQQLAGYDYILCDGPGLGLRSIDEIQTLKSLMPRSFDLPNSNCTVHLVLNSTAKDQDLTEMGRRYRAVHFKDVIFTYLDDSVQHGTIFNFSRRFDVPLHSFGVGTRVPEDFEMATRERVVDLIFKLSKVKKEGQ